MGSVVLESGVVMDVLKWSRSRSRVRGGPLTVSPAAECAVANGRESSVTCYVKVLVGPSIG
jgi:hypothetical protein